MALQSRFMQFRIRLLRLKQIFETTDAPERLAAGVAICSSRTGRHELRQILVSQVETICACTTALLRTRRIMRKGGALS